MGSLEDVTGHRNPYLTFRREFTRAPVLDAAARLTHNGRRAATMLIETLVTGPFQENTYLVAADEGAPCVL
ncbi:MAG: hypothetical protein ACYTFD_06515, partial [Planctomycetota bacterium]